MLKAFGYAKGVKRIRNPPDYSKDFDIGEENKPHVIYKHRKRRDKLYYKG